MFEAKSFRAQLSKNQFYGNVDLACLDGV